MNGSARKRLERVAELLTPMQATLLEIREATKFGTIENFLVLHADCPGWKWKLEERIRQRMSGRPDLVVDTAIERWRSELLFLWNLHAKVNRTLDFVLPYYMEDVLYCARSPLLISNLIEATSRVATGKATPENVRPQFTILIERDLGGLYAIRRAVAKIQREYFGGQPIVMESYVVILADVIVRYEHLARISNAMFLRLNRITGRYAKELEHVFDSWVLNTEQLEDSSEARAAETVSDWVDQTKAGELIRVGRVSDAVKLLFSFTRSPRARADHKGPSLEAPGSAKPQ